MSTSKAISTRHRPLQSSQSRPASPERPPSVRWDNMAFKVHKPKGGVSARSRSFKSNRLTAMANTNPMLSDDCTLVEERGRPTGSKSTATSRPTSVWHCKGQVSWPSIPSAVCELLQMSVPSTMILHSFAAEKVRTACNLSGRRTRGHRIRQRHRAPLSISRCHSTGMGATPTHLK